MDHSKDQRMGGEPDQPQTDRESGHPYRPFAPGRDSLDGQRTVSDREADRQPALDGGEPAFDRRSTERRQIERRTMLTMGGRRNHEDRRRHDRRVKLAGAGLLAAVAFGVGGHEIASRMDVPSLGLFGSSS